MPGDTESFPHLARCASDELGDFIASVLPEDATDDELRELDAAILEHVAKVHAKATVLRDAIADRLGEARPQRAFGPVRGAGRFIRVTV